MMVKAGGGELGVVLLAVPVGLALRPPAPGVAGNPERPIGRVPRLLPPAGPVPRPTPGQPLDEESVA